MEGKGRGVWWLRGHVEPCGHEQASFVSDITVNVQRQIALSLFTGVSPEANLKQMLGLLQKKEKKKIRNLKRGQKSFDKMSKISQENFSLSEKTKWGMVSLSRGQKHLQHFSHYLEGVKWLPHAFLRCVNTSGTVRSVQSDTLLPPAELQCLGG